MRGCSRRSVPVLMVLLLLSSAFLAVLGTGMSEDSYADAETATLALGSVANGTSSGYTVDVTVPTYLEDGAAKPFAVYSIYFTGTSFTVQTQSGGTFSNGVNGSSYQSTITSGSTSLTGVQYTISSGATVAQVAEDLGSIKYDGEGTITITAGKVAPADGDVFFGGHYYRVSSDVDYWWNAMTAIFNATDRTTAYAGYAGHPVTITSVAENKMMSCIWGKLTGGTSGNADYTKMWLGAVPQSATATGGVSRAFDTKATVNKDQVGSGYKWIWGTPEGDATDQTGNVLPEGSDYWASDEPSAGYAVYFGFGKPKWDDLDEKNFKENTGYTKSYRYVTEYSPVDSNWNWVYNSDGGSATGAVDGFDAAQSVSNTYSSSDFQEYVSITLPDELQTTSDSGDLKQSASSFTSVIIEPEERTTIFTDTTISTLNTALSGSGLTATLSNGKITISGSSTVSAVKVGPSKFVTSTGYNAYYGEYVADSTVDNDMGVTYDATTGKLSWNGAEAGSPLAFYKNDGSLYYYYNSSTPFYYFYCYPTVGTSTDYGTQPSSIVHTNVGDFSTNRESYASTDTADPWINVRKMISGFTPSGDGEVLWIKVCLCKSGGGLVSDTTYFYINAGDIDEIKRGTDSSDIDITDLGIVQLSDGSATSRTFVTSEGRFTGYVYDISFSVSEVGAASGIGAIYDWTEVYTTSVSSAGGERTHDVSSSYTWGNLTATLSDGDVVGSYVLTVTRSGDMDREGLALKAVLTAEAVDGQTVTATLYYILNVYDTAPAGDMTIGELDDVTGGVYYIQPVTATISGESFLRSDYRWYATGLPEGLSMSSSGYISGTYVGSEDISDEDNVTITAENIQTGEFYSGKATLRCTAFSDPGPSFSVTVNGSSVADGGATVVRSGQEAVLKISSSGTDGTYSVLTVGPDGSLSAETPDDGQSELHVAGTGAYRVAVTAKSSDGYEVTVSFYLYVMPVFGDLEARITVSA